MCLAQSGDTAEAPKAGVFKVRLGSMNGPVVATVPAEGKNSDCAADGSSTGTVNGTAPLSQTLNGIHDLYFIYDNGTPGHPYAYDLDAAAEKAIADAAAVIVVAGTTNAEASEEMDRVNIDLPSITCGSYRDFLWSY